MVLDIEKVPGFQLFMLKKERIFAAELGKKFSPTPLLPRYPTP
ncbi:MULTISPECIES: hypothetical protein [unclassified Okeania]|nr:MULTISPECIES: hypothetical protein [unclassified Okeania]